MDAKGKLILWLAGSGFNQAKTDEVLADKRIQWELEQQPIDAVGLMQELPYDARPKDAREKLDFLMVFNSDF